MKINRFFSLLMMAILVISSAKGADLMDVYKDALANDPQFKGARAKWLADRETLAIARSSLLPQLSVSGNLTRSRAEYETNSSQATYYSNNPGYALKLTQSIFNFGNWSQVWGAQAVAKRAQASFLEAEEKLLLRTAEAYFEVLQAKDLLAYARANKTALARLFTQAKHKYDVGLVAVVDYEDSRQKYDLAIAEEIAAINDLSNKFEKLNEITKVRYEDLDSVEANFPLLMPHPANIDEWVKVAVKQNFRLAVARYDAMVARENVKTQNAGHLPTLDAVGNYQYSYSSNASNNDIGGDRGFSRSKTASLGLQLNMPVVQGGRVVASAKQADYQYQEKLSTQEQTYRSVISETRQTYLGIVSNISKIKADIQAIKSAQSSFKANQASYSVGIRTMADVLTAQTQLYDAQKSFAKDEYSYIMQLLTLKALTGILAADDLAQINSWLVKATSDSAIKAVDKKKSINKPNTKDSVKRFNQGKVAAASNNLRGYNEQKKSDKEENQKITVTKVEEVKPITR